MYLWEMHWGRSVPLTQPHFESPTFDYMGLWRDILGQMINDNMENIIWRYLDTIVEDASYRRILETEDFIEIYFRY